MKYCDLQVNGAFGVDFNSQDLTLDQFRFACNQLVQIGVTDFLPTIITDSIPEMCRRISKIAQWVEDNSDLQACVRGIHVEGPFLSNGPGFYGTHPLQHIQCASEENSMRLIEAGRGRVKILTLAPEQDPDGMVTQRVRAEGVMVFAGHTNASYDQLRKSIDFGLVGFTHLGNGCVHQVDRQDNIMQRVLALQEHLFVTFIADGVHLPGWLLSSWVRIFGPDRSIIISDSMSAAGMPPGEYSIGGQPILVDAQRRTKHRHHGYLAGSASTMADMDAWLPNAIKMEDTTRAKLFFSNAYELLK